MDIYGIVLAGGQSRRMGGRDKAFVELGGLTMAAHVLCRLRPQCRETILSANGDPSRYAAFGVQVVGDDTPETLGPLAGILACLDWIADHAPDTKAAVTCAVDTPFLPSDLVDGLFRAAARNGTSSACAASGGRRHPVAALWPIEARHELRHGLQAHDGRRLSSCLDSLGCAEAEWVSEPFDPFININNPADLDVARGIIDSGHLG